MALTEITTGLPGEVTSQLMAAEKVYYFSFIAFKGLWLRRAKRKLLACFDRQEGNV